MADHVMRDIVRGFYNGKPASMAPNSTMAAANPSAGGEPMGMCSFMARIGRDSEGALKTARPSGAPAAPAGMDDELCRLVLAARTALSVLAAVGLSLGGFPGVVTIAATMVMLATSLLPYLTWSRIGPWLRRHQYVILADAVASAWLLTRFGPDSPCVLFTAAPIPLAGLLGGIRTALPFAAAELSAYAWAVTSHPTEGAWVSHPTTVAAIGLYAVGAAVGVALRGTLDRGVLAERAARESRQRVAVVEERARLARDLHDDFGKTLHGIGLAAHALPPWIQRDTTVATQRATALARSSDAAVSQLRQVITGLREDMLAANLQDAIRSTVHEWSAQSGIEAVADVDCTGSGRLDTVACAEVLAVLREALTNVERHADARRVSVKLRSQAREVELCVRDDGCGFDPPDPRHRGGQHFGLRGMSERARRVGGRLSVGSNPGEGTEVILCLPLAGVSSSTNGRPEVNSSRDNPGRWRR